MESPLLDPVRDDDEDEDVRPSLATPNQRAGISLMGRSSLAVIALGVCGFIEYSLVMPTLARYIERVGGGDDVGDTSLFYGVTMASFSLCRVLFMPLLGLWADRAPLIYPLLFSIFLQLVGNLLYALAEAAQTRWLILAGRCLVGMGAANSTLSLGYITRITTRATRTKALATINGLNLLGIVLGPATNLVINFTVEASPHYFNPYSNAGWIMVLIISVILCIMVMSFEEPPKFSADSNVAEGEEEEGDEEEEEEEEAQPRGCASVYCEIFFAKSLILHFVISFTSNFILAELETALPELTFRSYGWGTVQNSLLYGGVGLVTATSLIATATTSHFVSDRSFIAAGSVIYGVGLLVACLTLAQDEPPLPFFIGCLLMLIVAAPLTGSPNAALYSKRLSESKHAARYMSVFLSILDANRGVARTLGPLFAGFALSQDSHLVIYVGPAIVWALSAVVLVLGYPALKDGHRARDSSASSVVLADVSVLQSPMMITTPTIARPPHVHPHHPHSHQPSPLPSSSSSTEPFLDSDNAAASLS